MTKERFSRRAWIVIAVSLLASLTFLIAAVVIFLQKGDWPARYISVGVTILAVMFIAIRRRPGTGRSPRT
jgi:FtsH-binding integral membrane protein